MSLKHSLVVGASIVLGALVLGFILRVSPAPVAGAAEAPSAAAPQVGRFQMASTPGHVYVLDTATGQVWETFVSASQGGNDQDFKSPKVKPGR